MPDEEWFETKIPNSKIWTQTAQSDVRARGGVRPEIIEWLEEHVGPRKHVRQAGVWRVGMPLLEAETAFWFVDRDSALLFKLTWGGQ